MGRRLPKGFLTHGEIERILKAIPPDSAIALRDRAIVETYYATGIRRMEVANLDIEDVDLLSGMVQVNQGKGGKAGASNVQLYQGVASSHLSLVTAPMDRGLGNCAVLRRRRSRAS